MKIKIIKIILLLFVLLISINFSKVNKTTAEKVYNPIFVLSSRSFHPKNLKDTLNTFEAIEKLKPIRVDWMYCENKKVTDSLRKLKIPFSLTLNPQLPDSAGYTTKRFRIIDYNGKPYTAPWMKNWKIKNPYWGCANNPLFQKLFLNQGLKLAKLGAYALMVDDAILNTRLKGEKKVGCFCNYCTEGFKEYMSGKNINGIQINDKTIQQLKLAIKINVEENVSYSQKERVLIALYEQYQQTSVINFYNNWEVEIKKNYPNIKFLTNNYNGSWNTIFQVFDGGIAELTAKYVNNNSLDSLYAIADNLGKTQIFSIATDNEKEHFKLMEYNAKNKRETLLPWDVFVPQKQTRYYMPYNILSSKIKKLKLKYGH